MILVERLVEPAKCVENVFSKGSSGTGITKRTTSEISGVASQHQRRLIRKCVKDSRSSRPLLVRDGCRRFRQRRMNRGCCEDKKDETCSNDENCRSESRQIAAGFIKDQPRKRRSCSTGKGPEESHEAHDFGIGGCPIVVGEDIHGGDHGPSETKPEDHHV